MPPKEEKKAPELKHYTLEEVKVHNTKDDCWLIIRDSVYDVTKFLESHPGGKEILIMYSGTDATADFEDIFHSSDAEKLMEKYLVGVYTKPVSK
ncbi:MAG: putative Cytochrome b5 [Harvfovirus sp.]|uniref:Putative Cytochrome b5 n=1 Tax=Harvfovirus sp. TaxID=2487768 RepID=A0A3G5A3A1_9VIRU|nr:MAG: putative Cytochrome b5 [Harvfovirus sp.]